MTANKEFEKQEDYKMKVIKSEIAFPAAFPDGLKEAIRSEYMKVWKSEKMLSYCCNKLSRAVRLGDDCIVIFEKPRIETDFCFGERGYDYDDAQRMARHAQTSESYFMKKNMAEFEELESILGGKNHYAPYIKREGYRPETSLFTVTAYLPSQVEQESQWNEIRPLYGEALDVIIQAVRAEKAAFEKRLRTYLKRYGLSKVRSWTYWLDA